MASGSLAFPQEGELRGIRVGSESPPKKVLACAAILGCVVTTFVFAGLFPWEWLHPGGSGYWFYSGVFDAGILVTVISGVGVYWRSHNCHVRGCWRLDWHPHPDHGHPVCRLHHPAGGAEFLDAKYHRVKVSLGATSAANSSASTEEPNSSPAHLARPEHVSRNGSAVAAESDSTGGAGRVVKS